MVGVGVELGVGEVVGFLVVHGEEEVAGLDDGGEVGAGFDAASGRGDLDPGVGVDVLFFGVAWVDFDVDFAGVEFFEDGGF